MSQKVSERTIWSWNFKFHALRPQSKLMEVMPEICKHSSYNFYLSALAFLPGPRLPSRCVTRREKPDVCFINAKGIQMFWWLINPPYWIFWTNAHSQIVLCTSAEKSYSQITGFRSVSLDSNNEDLSIQATFNEARRTNINRNSRLQIHQIAQIEPKM